MSDREIELTVESVGQTGGRDVVGPVGGEVARVSIGSIVRERRMGKA